MNTHTVEGPTIKRLERSRSDRMLAGVCGGLASYFEIHPAFYRVGFVVLTLLGGAGVLIYIAAALVMPKEGEADSVASAALRGRRDRPWPLIGLGLLTVGGAVLLSHATLWPHGDAWVVLLIAGGAILWITRHGTKGETETTDPAELAAGDSHRIRRVLGWIAVTHLTHQKPRRPGATSRAGAPWPASRGRPSRWVASRSPAADAGSKRRV